VKAAKLLSFFAFGLLLAAILFFTFRASANVTDLSWMPQRWGLWLDDHDEFRHFIGFAIFAAAGFLLNFDSFFTRSRRRWVRRLRSSRYRTGRLGAFFVMVYLLELAQINMPNRDFDWLDVVNGWGGVVFAWAACVGWKFHRRRERRRAHERRHEPINVSSVRFR
jgi:hypothetical protein